MSATVPPKEKPTAANRAAYLGDRYSEVRRTTERLCVELEPEDYVIQSMPDCSPGKWHLAHTTWFYETFVLSEGDPTYKQFNSRFSYLFNSYYVQAGERWQRAQRGLLSRPTVNEVFRYREHVDRGMQMFLADGIASLPEDKASGLLDRVEIGLNHEQQHQELFITDMKHLFSLNPLHPVFNSNAAMPGDHEVGPYRWLEFSEAVRPVGYEGEDFSYDNEGPRHHQMVPAFELANRTVTCGEYMDFMADDGYLRPELWLSLGWAAVEANGWNAPLYWQRHPDVDADAWHAFTLGGIKPVDPNEPLTHISFFEADAYARWLGCDLPTEAMWETACIETGCTPDEGNFLDDGNMHPVAPHNGSGIYQMLGNVWEWTSSPYTAYPGYRPARGALGEYNGKFMCNQMVLRGGSCVTPRSHIRTTYRNFFPPDARWQFSGIRLARVARL